MSAARPPPPPPPAFQVLGRARRARAAVFQTAHGEVRTPAFMPVATRASLKGLTATQLEAIGPQVLLANTYHLHLRPGEARVRRLGGLHRFMAWERPLLTDSGGYQVFSLSTRVRVTDAGAQLKSHLDGEPVFLGPVEALRIQEALGADIIMAFDHCVGLPASREVLADAVRRTTAWARTTAEARSRDDQALFGIVQGGTDADLRAESARELVALDLPGYAIGGLAVGEGGRAMRETIAVTAPLLPEDRPRYLMGVGTPPDLLDAIAEGVDLFDCVLPTRGGRRGHLYTRDGPVRIAARSHEDDERPLDADCPCEACRRHTRAYLRHLFAVGEHSATTLGTLHNVTFFVGLVRDARDALLAGTFDEFRETFLRRYEAGESAWARAHAEDPEGAAGSRRAREERAARRGVRGRRPDPS